MQVTCKIGLRGRGSGPEFRHGPKQGEREMPSIVHNRWENFHRNIELTLRDAAAVERGPINDVDPNGPSRFKATADVLKAFVGRSVQTQTPIGLLGSAWSLSNLIGMESLQLETDELDGISLLDAAHLHSGSTLAAGRCAFVGGGAKTYQLVAFAEDRGMSIKTCGSYLGQSIAGSMATAVNGSTLGYGGFQNQIRGIHFVTGGNRSVWVERTSVPVLADAVAASFADEVIRDDAVFEDCLVHLGGMGIVNGVVFELVPRDTFSVVRIKRKVGAEWLAHLTAGDFHGVARMLGHDLEPAYYEVQVDPFDLYNSPALHTLYFRQTTPPPSREKVEIINVLDGLGALTGLYQSDAIWGAQAAAPAFPPDIFAYYAAYFFKETPGSTPVGSATWGDLHDTPPKARLRGEIYTSAFALNRTDLVKALALLSVVMPQAYAALPDGRRFRHLLYTLRFVSNPAGTMAFTRFAESVVLDMEGLMLSPSSEILGHATCTALDTVHIPYCPHWGKLQPPTAAKVEQEFGPSDDPESRVSRWRATRDRLVPEAARGVLWNKALYEWALIEGPPPAV